MYLRAVHPWVKEGSVAVLAVLMPPQCVIWVVAASGRTSGSSRVLLLGVMRLKLEEASRLHCTRCMWLIKEEEEDMLRLQFIHSPRCHPYFIYTTQGHREAGAESHSYSRSRLWTNQSRQSTRSTCLWAVEGNQKPRVRWPTSCCKAALLSTSSLFTPAPRMRCLYSLAHKHDTF